MFEVFWSIPARNQLATLWTNAKDRGAITTAVDEVDRLLRAAPHDQGESREANERIVIVSPLVVEVRVMDDDRRVEVLTVRRLRR